jgi:hypothetical protein
VSYARAEAECRHVAIISLAAVKDWRADAFYLERTARERWVGATGSNSSAG